MEEEAGVVIIIIIINSTSTRAPRNTSNANSERQHPSDNSSTYHYHYITHKAAVRANKKEKVIADHAGAKPSNINCIRVNGDSSIDNNNNSSSIN